VLPHLGRVLVEEVSAGGGVLRIVGEPRGRFRRRARTVARRRYDGTADTSDVSQMVRSAGGRCSSS
jgi:hypothetical protein